MFCAIFTRSMTNDKTHSTDKQNVSCSEGGEAQISSAILSEVGMISDSSSKRELVTWKTFLRVAFGSV